jgi:hypothetical protein
MATYLHLLKTDSSPSALGVIAEQARDGASKVVVVLTDQAPAPSLPPEVTRHRLGPGGLDHDALLDLIFSSDRVIAW